MDINALQLHIEALIFASQQPILASELLDYVSNVIEQPLKLEQVEEILRIIQEKYDSDGFAFSLKQSGGGFQFLTKHQFHETIMQLNGDKFIKKLSSSAMETLSIIAYKQPVTKSEIEFIRGVSADYSIQKLLEKELIVIAGRNEDAIGKPLIYATSKHFMDYLGINSPKDLPLLKEVGNMELIMPTEAAAAVPKMEQLLLIDETGNFKNFEEQDAEVLGDSSTPENEHLED